MKIKDVKKIKNVYNYLLVCCVHVFITTYSYVQAQRHHHRVDDDGNAYIIIITTYIRKILVCYSSLISKIIYYIYIYIFKK